MTGLDEARIDEAESCTPVLVIGGNGLLGRAWQKVLKQQGRESIVVHRHELDLTQSATIDRWVDGRCGLVVNCAGWNDVDQAETQFEHALQLNGYGAGELARRCRTAGVTLLYYSSDYVFDGRRSTPYPVDHPHAPINAYGRSKSFGERQVQESGCRHLIVRTSWLYAAWGRNFVTTIADLARGGEPVSVVNDQRGRPTNAIHLAAVSLRLAESGALGIWHVTDGGSCTWYELAREVVRLARAPGEVRPCRTDEFPRPAKRPPYSVLDLSKTEQLLGPMPDWRNNLDNVVQEMEDTHV